MKIKPYKITKKDYSYKPFIVTNYLLDKPRIPLKLILCKHKPINNLKSIIIEFDLAVEPELVD